MPISLPQLLLFTVLLLLARPAFRMLEIALSHLLFTLYQRRHGEPLPPLGLLGQLRFYRRVAKAVLLFDYWRLRFSSLDGLRQPAGEPTGPPVLCVHGYARNGSCMWGLRRALEGHGRATAAVSMGRPYRPIEEYAPPLAAALEELITDHPGDRIDVVAHSMGGVVLRLVLAQRPDLGAALGRIVTLGSPHHGTASVRGVAYAPELRQLDRDSDFIADLPDFSATAAQAEVITVATQRDFLIYPADTAHLPGSRTFVFSQIPHQGLVTEEEALRWIVGTLCEPKPGG